MAAGQYLPEANPGPAEDLAVTIKHLLEGLGKDNTMFANVQITGGGVITWSGTHLLWTQRLMAIPVEKIEFGSSGFVDIDCPTSGTVVYYQDPAAGGTTTVACTANGIPIGNWEALYYRFVRGSANTSDQTRFCVVHYKNADWSPDDGWILLATRNADNISSSVKVAVGITIPATGGTYDVDACLPDWMAPINVAGLSGLLADDQHVLDTEVVSAIEAASPLTLPAFTLGGTMDADSQALINVLDIELGTASALGAFWAALTAANAGTAWDIRSRDTSDIYRVRLSLSGGVDTAVWTFQNSTITGIVLSGALNANSQAITNHAQAISDNALVTVDGPAAGAPASGEYGRWTASGIEGRSKAEQLSDLNVADGADVTGSNAPQAHGASVHTNITREFFLPATGGYARAGTLAAESTRGVVNGGANADAPDVLFAMIVPDDFVSFGSIKAAWGSGAAAGNMRWGLEAVYSAAGETLITHSDSPGQGTTATGGTSIVNVQEPASPLTLSSLALGDHIGITFQRQGTSGADTIDAVVNLYGLLFTYTANQ